MFFISIILRLFNFVVLEHPAPTYHRLLMFANYLILRFCSTREIRELNRAQTFLVLQYFIHCSITLYMYYLLVSQVHENEFWFVNENLAIIRQIMLVSDDCFEIIPCFLLVKMYCSIIWRFFHHGARLWTQFHFNFL